MVDLIVIISVAFSMRYPVNIIIAGVFYEKRINNNILL